MKDDAILGELDEAIHALCRECCSAIMKEGGLQDKEALTKMVNSNKALVISLAQMRDLARVR